MTFLAEICESYSRHYDVTVTIENTFCSLQRLALNKQLFLPQPAWGSMAFFWETAWYIPGWALTCCVAKDDPKFVSLADMSQVVGLQAWATHDSLYRAEGGTQGFKPGRASLLPAHLYHQPPVTQWLWTAHRVYQLNKETSCSGTSSGLYWRNYMS